MNLLAIAVAITGAAPVPTVVPPTTCPDRTVCAADFASVIRGLQAAGYRAELKTNAKGEPFIASATNGNDFSVDFYSCDDAARKTGCKTLLIESWYESRPYLTQALANRFNSKELFGRAYINDKGDLDLEVAVAADGGMSLIQFKAWIDWYTAADADLGKLVDEALAASKKPGKAA